MASKPEGTKDLRYCVIILSDFSSFWLKKQIVTKLMVLSIKHLKIVQDNMYL